MLSLQVKIHTVLDLRDTPNGKVMLRNTPKSPSLSCNPCSMRFIPWYFILQVIINQYDHTLLVESILYHQFPSLGKFLYKHILPAGGAHHTPGHPAWQENIKA